jgi:capsule polysaccharide modification protein KpsS
MATLAMDFFTGKLPVALPLFSHAGMGFHTVKSASNLMSHSAGRPALHAWVRDIEVGIRRQ